MLSEGMYVADRYEIVSKIGAGGMSDVYKAKDHILGRYVAIKVLKQEFSEDRNFVVKFRTEAQSAAGLEHPNIVNIYDVGSEEGFHYIVMEYVEGITLKTYIEKKGRLSFKESVSIAIQVARGIEAAHNKDIIHRDIKPQNIIISTEGKVKVTDFGIAKAISSNTVSSDVMGSVHYTSPEHARNGQVDGRSDIYSLGIVMYEMVTGRVPFDGETTVAVAIQHLQEEMVSPAAYATNLPISMEKIILKCCQKNPDRRYQTIAELLNDLRKALNYPNEDFVVIAPGPESGPTKIITPEELKEISEMSVNDTNDEYDDDYDDEFDDDEYDEEEEELNPKVKKAVTIMFVALAAIIIVLIIYIFGAFLGLFKFGPRDNSEATTQTNHTTQSESPNSTEEFEMIDLYGMTVDEATLELEKLGLYMTIEYTEDDEMAAKHIVDQTPKIGDKVKKGDTVVVKVVREKADTTEYINVPDVTGSSEEDAVKTLEDKGLKADVDYEYSDTVEKGKVISQVPTGGSMEKGSRVRLVVSRGAESVKVPNVLGLSSEKAQERMEQLGLKVKFVDAKKHDENYGEGEICKQSVAEGKSVDRGTTITLTINIAKKVVVYVPKDRTVTIPAGATNIEWKLLDGENIITEGTAEDGTTSLTMSSSEQFETNEVVLSWVVSYIPEGATEPTTKSYKVSFVAK